VADKCDSLSIRQQINRTDLITRYYAVGDRAMAPQSGPTVPITGAPATVPRPAVSGDPNVVMTGNPDWNKAGASPALGANGTSSSAANERQGVDFAPLVNLIKTTIGSSYLVVGGVTAIPYVFAIAGLWLNARSADHTGRYSVHVLLSMVLGAVALVLSVVFGSVVALSVVLISLAMAGALAGSPPHR